MIVIQTQKEYASDILQNGKTEIIFQITKENNMYLNKNRWRKGEQKTRLLSSQVERDQK